MTSTRIGRTFGIFAITAAAYASLLGACEATSGAGVDGGTLPATPDGSARPDAPAIVCVPRGTVETSCGDHADDDCDTFIDCLDPDCDTRSCDPGRPDVTCTAGACVDATALPAVARLDNVRVTMRTDTAIIDFEPFAGARDYRVYALPAREDVSIAASGEVSIRNAVYRCGGDRPMWRRQDDIASGVYPLSLEGNIRGYNRTRDESVLGYVFLTPGDGRQPVYRVADPQLTGGYLWAYGAPPGAEFNGADYVVGAEARDRLVRAGGRDDGIVFYVSSSGTRPIYLRQYVSPDDRSVLLYTDGPERDVRDHESPSSYVGSGERFRVEATQVEGSVALHRVFYGAGHGHDVLAAGDARYAWVLDRGNQPINSVTWTGLTGETTLVVEALDQGCPFRGFIGALAAGPITIGPYTSAPTITIDQARLPDTGELFINGQHEAANRPRAIARALVVVRPEPRDHFDWYEGFGPSETWSTIPEVVHDNIDTVVARNEHISVESIQCSREPGHTQLNPILGEGVVAGCEWHIEPLGISPQLHGDRYLHVRMSTNIPSSLRRYPQIWLTTTPLAAADHSPSYEVPIDRRLGPHPDDPIPPPGPYSTINVQTFGPNHELQVQFCDRRGWGVGDQCPRANIYGYSAGLDPSMSGVDEPWLPLPVMSDRAGLNRPVQFDVYATTHRVFVFVDEEPAGCAELPAGHMPEGPVTVVFGTSSYHLDADDVVTSERTGDQFWRRNGVSYIQRNIDELGVELEAGEPAWDFDRLPCGTRYYSGF